MKARSPRLTADQKAKIIEMAKAGKKGTSIAKEMGIKYNQVTNVLRKKGKAGKKAVKAESSKDISRKLIAAQEEIDKLKKDLEKALAKEQNNIDNLRKKHELK